MIDRYLVPGTIIVILVAIGALLWGGYVHTHSSPICVNWIGVTTGFVATLVVGISIFPLGFSAYAKRSWRLGVSSLFVAVLAGFMYLGVIAMVAMCGGV